MRTTENNETMKNLTINEIKANYTNFKVTSNNMVMVWNNADLFDCELVNLKA